MTETIPQPSTAAGRALLAGRTHMEQSINGCVLCSAHRTEHVWVSTADILAIEREAASEARPDDDDLVEPPDPAIWADLPPTSHGHDDELWDPRTREWVPRVAASEAREPLRKALADMVSLATSGSARAHFEGAGIMQDPPHGDGRFVECGAPWCVNNQERLAAARKLLEADA